MPISPSRRSLLQGLGILSTSLLFSSDAGAATVATSGPLRFPRRAIASWVSTENARPGDGSWLKGHPTPTGDIEGYASAVSVDLGGVMTFFVSSITSAVTAKVYRMGYYQGLGARLVETRKNVRAGKQPTPVPDQYGTIDCNWPATFNLRIGANYLPGQYLVRIENAIHQYSFIPFLVRDDASSATYVYMSSVTTWQAYNTWGGFSLYREANATGPSVVSNSNRAVRVSFNRPYDRNFANGAADFVGNEFPMLFLCERLGLDLTYWTDVDLHQRGSQLTNHQVLLSLGHDEYYSPAMRNAVTGAITSGVNVAFFGANFCYRKIRFESGINGPDRLMVNYRSTSDPITATNPSLATVNWSSPPSNQPESTFSGSLYGGATGVGSLRVVDATGWLWRGTGLSEGAILPGALGGEFNHYSPVGANPANVQIFAHSQVAGGVGDVTYVAEPGQGGVFASGTGQWIYRLSNAPRLGGGWIPPATTGVTAPLTAATENILALFALGPAGVSAPSLANTAPFYG